MDSISFTSAKIHPSKIKMTSKMAQDEMNRFYYMQSVAKSNARIEVHKKRNLAKLRQLKNTLIEYLSKVGEMHQIELKIWP